MKLKGVAGFFCTFLEKWSNPHHMLFMPTLSDCDHSTAQDSDSSSGSAAIAALHSSSFPSSMLISK